MRKPSLPQADVVSITHFAEDILAKMRDGKMTITPPVFDALLAGVDAVKEVLTQIEKTSTEGDKDYSEIVQRLKSIAVGEGAAAAASEKPAVVELKAIVPEAPPPVIEKPEPLAAPKIEESPSAELARVVLDHPEHDDVTAPAGKTQANTAEAVAASSDRKASDSTIRVEVALLDRLMNLVGELVLTRNQILQYSGGLENKAIVSSSQRLNLITTELQENVMKTRMQPIGGIWNKLPRIVRDLSQSTEKEVDIIMEGAETELDKTILEAIKDPFTHIVRNSIDHGIEKPDERQRKNKARRGTIRLRAYHESGQVNIEINDDGAGINIERVKKKGVQQGLITEEQALRISEREALHLIFKPGFSTAEKVTSISGRGVGMDVVKTNIERIGGSVDVVNNPGRGTTLRIKIPLTLAIIPALVVSASGERFAIPQINVRELVRLEHDAAKQKIERIQGLEVYRLRGNLLPLISLRTALNLDAGTANQASEGPVNIVVLAADGRLFGLIVDSVTDTEEIVVKALDKHVKNLRVFAGSTIMGDGHVALILDTTGLLESAGPMETTQQQKNTGEKEAEEHTDQSTLLIFALDEHTRFAMPLSMVSRLEEIPTARIERTNDHEVVQYRGKIMPLLRMARHLNIECASDAETIPIIVFSNEDRAIGMAVHRILDIVDGSARPEPDSTRPGILGSAIIQGRTTVFVDPYALIEDSEPGFFSGKGAVGEMHRNQKQGSRVLILDESAFYRSLARSYLDIAGYSVIEASNATEALQRLRTRAVDIVVADCDTFHGDPKLAAALHGNMELQKIPTLGLYAPGLASNSSHMESGDFTQCLEKLDRNSIVTTVQHLLVEQELLQPAAV